MFFIKNLKFICENKNISQNQLAKETGLPVSSVKNLFQHNKVKSPNLENAYKIAKYLKEDLTKMIEIDYSQSKNKAEI